MKHPILSISDSSLHSPYACPNLLVLFCLWCNYVLAEEGDD